MGRNETCCVFCLPSLEIVAITTIPLSIRGIITAWTNVYLIADAPADVLEITGNKIQVPIIALNACLRFSFGLFAKQIGNREKKTSLRVINYCHCTFMQDAAQAYSKNIIHVTTSDDEFFPGEAWQDGINSCTILR